MRLRECVLAWANESLELAWHYAYQHPDGREVAFRDEIGDGYYQAALAVVREQLVKAAVRLAFILNNVL